MPVYRRHSKSLAHFQIQLHLKSLIPSLALEKRVKNRIADTLWEEQKIIFEIQCSPISLDEATSRCNDYISWGYTPVWILHDRTFNRHHLTPAEEYLRSHTPTYFTNGHLIYDQFDVAASLQRTYKGPPLPLDLTRPAQASPLLGRHWPLSFSGDLFHWAKTNDLSFLRKMVARHSRSRRFPRWRFIYKFLLYRLLEKWC
jgi:hypothetical protein